MFIVKLKCTLTGGKTAMDIIEYKKFSKVFKLIFHFTRYSAFSLVSSFMCKNTIENIKTPNIILNAEA